MKDKKEKEFVSREKLKPQLTKMLDELNQKEFHNIYNIVWSLTAKQTLIDSKNTRIECLEEDIKKCNRG